MIKFVTLSSMFVGNATLLIVYVVSAEIQLAMMPLLGSVVTGSALTRMLLVPEKRPTIHEDK